MLDRKNLSQPENPSKRYPLMSITLKCDYCGLKFTVWKQFLDHLEKSSHRVCYKCGHSCGGMEQYRKGEYIAIHQVNGNIESWKYKHYECPVGNPSQRGI